MTKTQRTKTRRTGWEAPVDEAERKRRLGARAFVYGIIESRVFHEGRNALAATCPITSQAIRNLLDTPEAYQTPWSLCYQGGDIAILTWNSTLDKEVLAVSEDHKRKTAREVIALATTPTTLVQ